MKLKRWVLVPALALFLIVIVFHPMFLTIMAQILEVREPLETCDCIVVLAGERGERVREAVALYHEGYAPVLLMSGGPSEANIPLAELMRAQALKEGVPEKNILLETRSLDTGEDALFTKEIILKKGFRSILLVTSPYHSRRALMIFRKVYAGCGVKIVSFPVRKSWFRVKEWWRRKKDTKVVLQEYSKLLWYLLSSKSLQPSE